MILTGWAGLKTALTVPEVVTLDLTAEGAVLELQDGAVLTVNATGHGDHGKGWVEGSLRMGNDAEVIAGTGTISLKSKGRLLNIGSDKGKRQLTLDGVTLVGLPDNDNSLIGINENGGLVLKSGAITGNIRLSDDWASGGGVEVWRGTFVMEGGVISGNSATGKNGSGGGGVQISEEAVFTMSGGVISGNSAQGNIDHNNYGGGVRIGEEAVFTMSGSVISGNSTQGPEAKGGGVRVSGGSSTFTMSGGTIYGNSVEGSVLSFGGGVYVGDSSTFTMSGGRIQSGTDSDGFTKNILTGGNNQAGAALCVDMYAVATAKWGMGGTYTKGGTSQTGGSDIGDTDDTLIATPGQ